MRVRKDEESRGEQYPIGKNGERTTRDRRLSPSYWSEETAG